MADITIWIQLENHTWDLAPKNLDRMTGQTIQQLKGEAPQSVTLVSPETSCYDV